VDLPRGTVIRSAWLVALALAACGVARPADQRPSRPQTKGDVQLSATEQFKCNKDNSKFQALHDSSNKHFVTLSWKASLSLSTPPAKGDGYNLYRFDVNDHSCTKINKDLLADTSTKDEFVELGKTYQYAARAFKHNRESKPSNVVELTIPSK
jgi:hypothetical protein